MLKYYPYRRDNNQENENHYRHINHLVSSNSNTTCNISDHYYNGQRINNNNNTNDSNNRKDKSQASSNMTIYNSSRNSSLESIDSNESMNQQLPCGINSTVESDNSDSYELDEYLPPYRSLLSPNTRYDYKHHQYVDASTELKFNFLMFHRSKDRRHNQLHQQNSRRNQQQQQQQQQPQHNHIPASLTLSPNSTSVSSSTSSFDTPPTSSGSTCTISSNSNNSFSMPYRSLLTPINNTRKKFLDAASDTLSIKSFRSTLTAISQQSNAVTLKKMPTVIPLNILDLPEEIMLSIFELLEDDVKSLIYLLYTNRKFNKIVKQILYKKPKFTSTYRVAQFVHTIICNKDLALMVKELDLSHLKSCIIDEDDTNEYFFSDLINRQLNRTVSNRHHNNGNEHGTNNNNNNEGNQNDHNNQLLVPFPENSNTNNNHNINNDAFYENDEDYDSYNDSISDDRSILAGWRDWRYRDHPLYGLKSSISSNPYYSITRCSSPLSTNSSINLERTSRARNSRSRSRSNSLASSTSLFSLNNRSLESDLSSSLSPTRPLNSRKNSKSSFKNNFKKLFGIESSNNMINSNVYADLYRNFSDKNSNSSPNHSHRVFKFRNQKNNNYNYSSIDNNNNKFKNGNNKIQQKLQPFSTPHPNMNRFLTNHCFSKDLPAGHVMHVLRECKNLQVVNFSGLSISVDFELNDYKWFDWNNSQGKISDIVPNNHHRRYSSSVSYSTMLLDNKPSLNEEELQKENENCQKFKIQRQIYWSDTTRELDLEQIERVSFKNCFSKENNHNSLNNDAISNDNSNYNNCNNPNNSVIKTIDFNDVLNEIKNLKNLKTISLNSLVGLSKKQVYNLILNLDSINSNQLIWLDCSNSGMAKGLYWAKKRNMKSWKKLIKYEIKHGPPSIHIQNNANNANNNNNENNLVNEIINSTNILGIGEDY
ncbi:hypothetical protein B5S28_g4205 [[Candida] boidinii]|nr:hypothetical protein B5S28_g4205 [[Candida] boidinii]GME86415.1 unnamed protein product [[Candida] boidinii]